MKMRNRVEHLKESETPNNQAAKGHEMLLKHGFLRHKTSSRQPSAYIVQASQYNHPNGKQVIMHETSMGCEIYVSTPNSWEETEKIIQSMSE